MGGVIGSLNLSLSIVGFFAQIFDKNNEAINLLNTKLSLNSMKC